MPQGVNLRMSSPVGMCHYFGYFFWVSFPGFLGVILLVKFDFFKNNPDFFVLILIFINDIVECCLQGSCFLFSSVRFIPEYSCGKEWQ